jgi:hypothetical protein
MTAQTAQIGEMYFIANLPNRRCGEHRELYNNPPAETKGLHVDFKKEFNFNQR